MGKDVPSITTNEQVPTGMPGADGLAAMLAAIGDMLDGLGVAMCIFDEDDCTLVWNGSFLRLFPEHAGHVHAGEPCRANLRRFYDTRLSPEGQPRLGRYIEAGIARHHAQTQPCTFDHRDVRDDDVVARIGGDEFAILQRGSQNPESALRLAQRLIDAIGEPTDIESRPVQVGASIGVLLSPRDGTDPHELVRRADAAMYAAKAAGRGCVRLFGVG